MNKLIMGLVATAAFVGPAIAADMPIKALPPAVQVYTWTGCYLGVNGGYAWGRDKVYDTADTFIHDVGGLRGGVAGGQVGCDYQMNQFVFGLELMYDWANIRGDGTDPALPANVPAAVTNTQINGVGTFTSRAGMLFNNNMTLAYFKSGFAAQYVKDRQLFPGGAAGAGVLVQYEDGHFEPGVDVGVGIEHRFTQNLSLKVEYNHMWFRASPTDRQLAVGAFPAASFTRNSRTDLDVVTVGLNWRFTPWPVKAAY